MKKILLLLCAILIISGCAQKQTENKQPPQNEEPKISQEEQEFNDSGRAKAIIDETDLWYYKEDNEAGFSIKYPHNANITIESEKIDNLEGTMGFNKETALKNMEALKNGKYGENVDWPLPASKKVVALGDKNAQSFMVLSRFEVCDVTFERKLYFFNNNHQVVITSKADKDLIMDSMSEYFKTDTQNCSEEKVWNFDKQKDFLKALEDNNGSEAAQNWFNTFDKITETIEFIETDPASSLEKLQGKWTSLDDRKSVIEFTDKKKIDYYDGKMMSEGELNLDGGNIIIKINNETFEYIILELTDEKLILSYLPRGNTLEYKR